MFTLGLKDQCEVAAGTAVVLLRRDSSFHSAALTLIFPYARSIDWSEHE